MLRYAKRKKERKKERKKRRKKKKERKKERKKDDIFKCFYPSLKFYIKIVAEHLDKRKGQKSVQRS